MKGQEIGIMDSEEKIPLSVAFAAMYAYLEAFYERTKSDDIAMMLGDLSLLEDGSTADPAAWEDWIDAIRAAKQGTVNLQLKLRDTK